MTVTVAKDNETNLTFPTYHAFTVKNSVISSKSVAKIPEKKQEQKQHPSQKVKSFTPKTYPRCPHYQKTNQPPENCWNGPNAANRPQKFKQHTSPSHKQESLIERTSTQNASPSILKNPSNYQSQDSNGQK